MPMSRWNISVGSLSLSESEDDCGIVDDWDGISDTTDSSF